MATFKRIRPKVHYMGLDIPPKDEERPPTERYRIDLGVRICENGCCKTYTGIRFKVVLN